MAGWGRRIRLYLVGFGLGVIICLIMFRGRDITGCTPTRRVTTMIAATKRLEIDSTMLCKLKCEGIPVDTLRKAVLAGDVDFDASKPRKEPAHEYLVKVNVKGKPMSMYFSTNMADSTVKLLIVDPPLNGENCGCK